MKRFLAIFVMLTMVIGIILTGCGSKSATPESGTSAVSTAQTQASTTEETKPAENVTLQFYLWMATAGKHPDNVIAAFEKKYPNIKITPQTGIQDVAQYVATEKMKLLSGDADIVEVRCETINDFAKASLLMDLTDQPFVKNYEPSCVEQVKAYTDGKLYSAPEYNSTVGIYYNKDMFTKNNWAIPKDFNAFLTLCDTIKAAGVVPFYNGYKDGWTFDFGVTFPIMTNLLVKNPDIFTKIANGQAKYTDPLFVYAFTQMDTLFKKGLSPQNDLALSYGDSMTLFKQGKAAMWLTGDWMMAQLGTTDFTLGVAPLPENAPGEELVQSTAVVSTLGVGQNSKNKDAALKFLEFCSNPDVAGNISKDMGSFTSVKGAATDFNPIAPLFAPLHAIKSVNLFYSLMNSNVNAALQKNMASMFAGKMTPQQLAKSIQDAQDKVGK